ncbi:MAG TPA: hypothetical protein VFU02_13805, partial [Polyangiaceae bacterium]|nr:hypothetical protein [Polyangiaceae bacterium]
MGARRVTHAVLFAGWIVLVAAPAAAQETPAPGPVDTQKSADEKQVKEGKPTDTPKLEVKESEKKDSGEKTYQFGEVEVEGRLKAPQILYFLRRVRAEFRAGLLGHRSFMPELSDTR